MKKIVLTLSLLVATAATYAQTATQVLDKAAQKLTVKSGFKADFKATTPQGTITGTIAVKGNKFMATTQHTKVWFDGKTQWTYMTRNDEVNVSNPKDSELQSLNPYNFINIYKKGYKSTMTKEGDKYIVHLTAESKSKKVQELFVTVDSKTNTLTQVKMLQGKKWMHFDVSNLKQENLSDVYFHFNAKDFPTAEVIDLR
jgi:outer membrane lipoprotein-sorting protein